MAKLPDLYPHIASVFKPTLLARGDFGPIGPTGITVHHAAGRSLQSVYNEAETRKEGYHLVIDREGLCHQVTYFTHTVAHAGKAQWMGESPNRAHIAISLLAWGRLLPAPAGGWMSYAKSLVKPADVAFRPSNLQSGNAHWDAFTQAQEQTLFEVLKWAIDLGMDPRNICGHDECALPIGRKDDPGGSLSMTMAQLRMKFKTDAFTAKLKSTKPST